MHVPIDFLQEVTSQSKVPDVREVLLALLNLRPSTYTRDKNFHSYCIIRSQTPFFP